MLPFLLVAVILAAAITVAALAHRAERMRREGLVALAQRLGFEFHANDPYGLALRYERFAPLAIGDNRYAYNVMEGERPPIRIHAFDWHYQTYSTDSKGNRQTDHHHASFVCVDHRYDLGRLAIRPEGFFDKVADAFGADDIDFESAEFSRKYWVKADDKRLAYDVLSPPQIEFLVGGPPFGLLCEGTSTLVSLGDGRVGPEGFERLLALATGFHQRVPDFVKRDRGPAAGRTDGA